MTDRLGYDVSSVRLRATHRELMMPHSHRRGRGGARITGSGLGGAPLGNLFAEAGEGGRTGGRRRRVGTTGGMLTGPANG